MATKDVLTIPDVDIHTYNYVVRNMCQSKHNIQDGTLSWNAEDQTLTVEKTKNINKAVSEILGDMHREIYPFKMENSMHEMAKQFVENEEQENPNVYAKCEATSEIFNVIVISDSAEVGKYVHKLKVHLDILTPRNRKTRKIEPENIPKNVRLESELEPPKDYFITFEKIEVFIEKKDIMELDGKVECFVNPTNSQLTQNGKVSQILVKKGGSKYKKACYKLEPMRTTMCICSHPGSLNVKSVLHAACPQKDDYFLKSNKLNDDVFSTIFNCLQTVEEKGLTSVAFPFICSGQAGIRVKTCCKQYVAAIVEFSRQRKQLLTCTEIHFVDIEEEKVRCAQEIFSQYLPKKFSQRLEIPTDYDTVIPISEQVSEAEVVERPIIKEPTPQLESEENPYDTVYSHPENISKTETSDNLSKYDSIEVTKISYGQVGGKKRQKESLPSSNTSISESTGYENAVDCKAVDCKAIQSVTSSTTSIAESTGYENAVDCKAIQGKLRILNADDDSPYTQCKTIADNQTQDFEVNGTKIQGSHSSKSDIRDISDYEGAVDCKEIQVDCNNYSVVAQTMSDLNGYEELDKCKARQVDDNTYSGTNQTLSDQHEYENCKNRQVEGNNDSSITLTTSYLAESEREVDCNLKEIDDTDYSSLQLSDMPDDIQTETNDKIRAILDCQIDNSQLKRQVKPGETEQTFSHEVKINGCKIIVYKGEIRNIDVDAIVCPEDLSINTETNGLIAAGIKVKFRHSFKSSKLKCLSVDRSKSRTGKTVTTTDVSKMRTNVKAPNSENKSKRLSKSDTKERKSSQYKPIAHEQSGDMKYETKPEGLSEDEIEYDYTSISETAGENYLTKEIEHDDGSSNVRYILHVVTPFWKPNSDNPTFTAELENCMGAVFEKIIKHNKKRKTYSVAFPLMGISEIDNEDSIRKSCSAMSKSIQTFCQGQKSGHRVTTVHIVNRCDQITDMMWQELTKSNPSEQY